ncbi:hypothetical protein SISNIDRAFT_488154 [Sistotremastrum niveocremeum HHB9708]|uniref:Uncharacterized protein n=1 Tax=Sistotremastrum niveocremeum HHB9708 TaxID=1314777 RepID=A0A164RI39_9AGAM|nr:hypothetical protein SISNIDRAFT_488154 [Sistotremastrum niveocremeum HHB9708]
MPSLWRTCTFLLSRIILPLYIISWGLNVATVKISAVIQPLCYLSGWRNRYICTATNPSSYNDLHDILPALLRTQTKGFSFLTQHSHESNTVILDLIEARVKIDDLIVMVRSATALPHAGEIIEALEKFNEDAQSASKRVLRLKAGLNSALERTLLATDYAFRALAESERHPLDPRRVVCEVSRIADAGSTWGCPPDPLPKIETAVAVFEGELKTLLGQATAAGQAMEDLRGDLSIIQTFVSMDIIANAQSLEEVLGSLWGYLLPFLPNVVASDLRRQAGVLRQVMVYRERAHRFVIMAEEELEGMTYEVESIRRSSARALISDDLPRHIALMSVTKGLDRLRDSEKPSPPLIGS